MKELTFNTVMVKNSKGKKLADDYVMWAEKPLLPERKGVKYFVVEFVIVIMIIAFVYLILKVSAW